MMGLYRLPPAAPATPTCRHPRRHPVVLQLREHLCPPGDVKECDRALEWHIIGLCRDGCADELPNGLGRGIVQRTDTRSSVLWPRSIPVGFPVIVLGHWFVVAEQLPAGRYVLEAVPVWIRCVLALGLGRRVFGGTRHTGHDVVVATQLIDWGS